MNRRLFNAQMAQYTTPTITGESGITIESGIKCYLPELKVAGNTTQQTYTGKNLFYQNGSIGQSPGVTCTYNEETQEFTINGTKTANGNVIISRNMKLPKLREDRQYRISRYVTGGSMEWGEALDGAYVQMIYSFFKQGSTTSFGRIYEYPKYNNPEVFSGVVTMPADTTEYTVYVQIGGANVYNNWTFKLMLEEYEGQAAGEYEPYKPLSPDYPQDIINAGDNGVEVEVRGVNILDATRERSGNTQGIKFSQSNNIITLDGSLTSGSAINVYQIGDIALEIGKTYTGKIEFIGGELLYGGVALYLYRNGSFFSTLGILKSGNSVAIGKKIIDTEGTYNIRIAARTETTPNADGQYINYNNVQIRVSLYEGSYTTDTIPSYEPYIEPQKITIPSSVEVDGEVVDLRFAKVGDYADRLIVDGVNKTVTYQESIRQKIFTGNEAFSIASSGYPYKLEHMPSDYKGGNNLPVFCNRFRNVYISEIYKTSGEGSFCQFGTAWYFNYDSQRGGVHNFKAILAEWYNNNEPAIVQYALANPIDYDITNTPLGEQLLRLIQNNGTTIIEASNTNNLSQTLTTKYLTHV